MGLVLGVPVWRAHHEWYWRWRFDLVWLKVALRKLAEKALAPN
jgi:hypothetical protein